jgi:hypothetical protein
LFFYGTLLDPDIQRRVVGRALTGAAFVPASLQGFRRVRAAGQWFPILVPGLRSDLVEGGLATDLDGREIARIVAYESTDKPACVHARQAIAIGRTIRHERPVRSESRRSNDNRRPCEVQTPVPAPLYGRRPPRFRSTRSGRKGATSSHVTGSGL